MDSSERIERRAAQWLARRDGAGWDARAQAAFEAWLSESTAHRVAALRLEAAWRESGRLQVLAAGDGAAADARAPSTPAAGAKATARRAPAGGGCDPASLVFASRPRPRRSPVPLAAAAGLAAALALAAGWWLPRAARLPEPVLYSTTTGAIQSLALADGSQATLSSDSAISVRLGRDERDIGLARGEAFFQVSHDPGRPFVVSAGEHEVVAVGTRFAVRRDASGLRVVVTEGVVRLQPQRDAPGARPTTLLPAGSIALAGPNGVLVRTGSVRQAEDALAWRDGLLSFRDTPLADAAAEFNRYSTRKLVIADPDVAAVRIGGSFKWSNTDAFVRLLERGFPVRAEYRGDRIELHRR